MNANGLWAAYDVTSKAFYRCTCSAEVEEHGQLSPAWQPRVGLPQLVEEGVRAGLQRREARGRRVLQQARAKRDGFGRRARFEHLKSKKKKFFN